MPNNTLQRSVGKNGDSFTIVIPPPIVKEFDIKKGDLFRFSLDKGKIVMERV